MTGDLLGTLRYMSPEQALAKHGLVDHRTDVYALGATLYELLTLRPAVEGEDREEVLRKITFEEPRPPRTLTQGIPIELETVLLKAMAKDPGARYATAQELADDLERFLRGEPIQARRISRLGQVWRWCRRNPLVASLLAVTVGLLAAVLVVGLVGYLQTRAALGQVTEEKQQAEANAAEARRQRYHAEANFGKALNILTDFMRKLDRTDGSRSPEKEAIRQALREHMETFFQRFLKENSEDPLVRSETAWAYDHLGLYDHKQGDTARAEKYFRKALAILQDRAEQFRTHFRYVGMLSHTYWRLGWLLEDTGRSREALESFRRTVEYARLALTLNRDADELNRLAWPLVICPYPEVRNPPLALQLAQEAVKLANERADLWNTLGGAYYRMGDWDAAVAALEKAVKLSRKGGKADDHFFLAMSHHRRGEEREARSWYEQGVRQMSRYPSDLFLQNEAAALLGIKNPSLPREKEDSPRKK